MFSWLPYLDHLFGNLAPEKLAPDKLVPDISLAPLRRRGSGIINSILIHIETHRCRTHNVALRGFTMEDIDDYCRMLTEALIKMN